MIIAGLIVLAIVILYASFYLFDLIDNFYEWWVPPTHVLVALMTIMLEIVILINILKLIKTGG